MKCVEYSTNIGLFFVSAKIRRVMQYKYSYMSFFIFFICVLFLYKKLIIKNVIAIAFII